MNQTNEIERTRTAVAILRIILGLLILLVWVSNIRSGIYTADGLTGFFNWLFDAENGNGSSLTFYKSFLDAVIVPVAGLFGAFQLVTELLLGLGLLLGGLTRFFGIAAMFFFGNLFLSYFGGHEWIGTYVLLFTVSLTVALSSAGRKWGIDQLLLKQRGEPRFPFLW